MKKPSFRAWLPRRMSGVMRVIVYLGVISVAITAAAATRAYGKAEQAMQRSGLQLLRQLGPALIGPPQAVKLNGQRLLLSSKTTSLGVAEALSEFERHCRTPTNGDEPPAAASRDGREIFDVSRFLSSRIEDPNGGAGQVACLVPRDGRTGLQAFVDRIKDFSKSFDLTSLGEMRYAVARRAPGSNTTHVLVIWAAGSLSIPAMFPKSGDAPGGDSEVVPRPPGAVRVLAAEIETHPYALRMYDSQRSHAEVLGDYDRRMAEGGWAAQRLETQPNRQDLNQNVRAFTRHGAAVLVVVNDTPEGKTGVSLIEMGTPGHVRAEVGRDE